MTENGSFEREAVARDREANGSYPLTLEGPVQYLRGVGPRRAEAFAQLGVMTVGDLLEYYPRGYEFRPPMVPMKRMCRDHQVTVVGRVVRLRYVSRRRPPRLDVVVEDETDRCHLVWFHGGYLRDAFVPGDVLAAWGKVSVFKEVYQLVNPRWRKLEDAESLVAEEDLGLAVYPASGSLSSTEIGRIIRRSLEAMAALVPERYEESFRRERQLPMRREALGWIHRPADEEQIGRARRRLAYDELFLMELGLALRRERRQRRQPAYALPVNDRLDKRIRRLFPFTLTGDQDRAVGEICVDMARTEPMNRLLQGDVGSGKTVVALYAALLAVGHHRQAAIMAPTEILAEQHFEGIERYLKHSRVKRVLLKGGLTGRKRAETMAQIGRGEIDLVVGTQALLQQDVAFRQLGLVVIDEQHKFGVRQREVIRSKDIAPHCLVMTATPIPRTLALTVFGDLDVSTIKEMPPGRGTVETYWYPPEKIQPAYEFIRSRVKQGEQVYIVYPRVEESGEEGLTEVGPNGASRAEEADRAEEVNVGGGAGVEPIKAAVAEYEYLRREVFTEFEVGLLHGRLERGEKQATMAAFRAGRIQILVTTVVIEVGVDVPAATIMAIEHAERFGLAQLHQLRGRIGRGRRKSYCLLFARASTDQSRQRLEIMTQTSDGFRIAEEDLRIRGPGWIFGTAQHGLPPLKIADLLEDFDLLRMARRDAFAAARSDPELGRPEHQVLRAELQRAFGSDLGLIEVG